MSDQTPAGTPAAQPPQMFDGQGFPIPQPTDVNAPTGLAIDGIPTGEEMSEQQINDALREAMRDEAGSFRPSVNEDTAGDGTWLGRNKPATDLDGAGGQESEVGAAVVPPQPDGTAAGGEGSPVPTPGSPPSNEGAPQAPQPAAPALPPGYILAPITEYNEFTGQSEIRYIPAPAEQIGNVLGWVNGIAPAERQQIVEWLEARRNGDTSTLPLPSPTGPSTASGGGPTPPGVPSGSPGGMGYQGQPVGPSGSPIAPDYSQYDPEVAQALYIRDQQIAATQASLGQVNQRLQSFEAQQSDFYARQAAEDRSRLQQSILGTTAQFIQEKGFTSEQGEALSQAAANLQILPTMNAKHNGDINAAVRETLETAMWMTPEFRSAAIQNELADSLTTNAATEERKRKAAAINGAGGTVPRVAPPAAPMTKKERDAAMVGEISTHMFNGNN